MKHSEIIESLNENEGLWGFIAIILTVILALLGYFSGFFQKLWKKIRKELSFLYPRYRIPRETLRLVPVPRGNNWYYGHRKKGKRKIKAIIVGCELYVTNITKGDILITATYMKKPRSESTIPIVKEAPPSPYWGRYPILSRRTTEMHATYVLDKSACKKGQDLIGDIAVIDQLGNEHAVRKVKFVSRG